MQIRRPRDYSQFHCLAGDCPHSCCIGWEVVLDRKTVEDYATVPGELGKRLRREMREVDGEVCFPLNGGRCPFLDEKNLCEIHRALGEEHTSATCRNHPRFVEEYGPLQEISLSVSCPAVRDMLLGDEGKLAFSVTEDEAPSAPWVDPDLPGLLTARQRAFTLLQDRKQPLRRRLAWFLLFANEVQALWDNGELAGIEELCTAYGALPRQLPEELQLTGEGIFPHGLAVLQGLSCLEPDWTARLKSVEEETAAPIADWAGERIACYFVYRYWLTAVADGDLLSRAEFSVFSVLAVERLTAELGLGEALRRYSREIEHCPENLQALQDAFYQDNQLSLERFFQELWKG